MKRVYRCGRIVEDKDYDVLITCQYLYNIRPNDYQMASCSTDVAIYSVTLNM
jgi:hypothetical protein